MERMAEDALPSGWQEIDDTDRDAGRYNPQPISRFEHGETGVGIRLTPADPKAGTGSGPGDDGENDYRVSVGEDGAGDMAPLTNASGHAGALGVAREFMGAYNERCIDGNEDTEALFEDFAGTD